jgi:hypothetical protein
LLAEFVHQVGGDDPPGRGADLEVTVRTFMLFVVWCVLFVLVWPLALLVLVLFPFVWLVSLPFRLVGITLEALFALLKTILFLPSRLLGYRG